MIRTFTKLFVFFVFCLFASDAMAKIIYVDASKTTGANNGSSWTDAFLNLQSALNDASSGDQIWVAKGIYKPSEAPAGLSTVQGSITSRDFTFLIPQGIKIYGGFAGGEPGTDINAITRFFKINETILSGDIGAPSDKSDNVYHVVSFVGHTASVLFEFDGFTVQDGYGDEDLRRTIGTNAYWSFYGAGIFVRNASGAFRNLVVKNNVVNPVANNTTAYAGGLFMAGAGHAITIEKALFEENKAFNRGTTSATSYSGAIFASAAISLQDIAFIGNETGNIAGAFYTNVTGTVGVTINRVKFINNIAQTSGGAVGFAGNSSAQAILNSQFYNNDAQSATAGGGAIYHAGAGTLNLINSTLYGNKATGTSGTGGGVYITTAGTTLNVYNSIFLDNTGTSGSGDIRRANGTLNITHSLTQGTTGTSVVPDADATNVFINTTGINHVDFLKLKTDDTNPAIDAGDNTKYDIALYGNKDLTGTADRVFNSGLKSTATIDMGAYENIITPLPVVLSAGLSAKVNGGSVVLSWETASETNNSHFILEKSTEGLKFTTIASVPSKGNGAKYTQTDFSPNNGTTYYRLTQVDNDGTKLVYDPISINFSLKGSIGVNIYPNPVISTVTIDFGGQTFNRLEIYNTAGQMIKNQDISVEASSTILDVTNLIKGVYFLKISGTGKTVTQKVIKN